MNNPPLSSGYKLGFTIVELLVVVVVIAILAAITIVAYNGITAQANDSARATDAGVLRKKIEVRHATTDEYGYGEEEPSTYDDFLELYEITPLGDRLVVCNYDTCPTEGFDKTKIYFRLYSDGMTFAHWSNSDNEWKSQDYYDNGAGDSVQTFETSEEEGPLYLGGSGGDT